MNRGAGARAGRLPWINRSLPFYPAGIARRPVREPPLGAMRRATPPTSWPARDRLLAGKRVFAVPRTLRVADTLGYERASLSAARAASLASSTREEIPSFEKMCDRWVITVYLEMYRRSAIWGLVRPSTARRATCFSLWVRASQPVAGRLRGALEPRRIPKERMAAVARAASLTSPTAS